MIEPAIGVVTPDGVETSGADPGGVYQTGSLTKVFTALLLALEVVDGRLTRQTRVGDVLPALDEQPVGGVTLGALVTHTSGLPRVPPGMWRKLFGASARNPYADIDEPALYAALGAVRLRSGTRPTYSNLGFGLLGTALARHLRTSYDEAVRERITGPLGMGQTRSHADAHQPGHTRSGRVHRQLWTFDALAGAGALWSSVTDLMVFVRAHLNPPEDALGDAIRLTQQPLVRAGRMEQAMAWMRRSGKDGSLLRHNGGTAGFRSFIGVDVGRQRGVVVLGNTDRSVDRLGFRLASAPRGKY
jgi:serine-type D-Ala-D-Ala carboxypeptidase/endopeptidase